MKADPYAWEPESYGPWGIDYTPDELRAMFGKRGGLFIQMDYEAHMDYLSVVKADKNKGFADQGTGDLIDRDGI